LGISLSTIIGLVAIGVLLAGIFFVSLAESALVGANPVAVRRRAERGEENARIVTNLHKSGNYLTALIIAMNAGILLISTIMTLLTDHELLHLAMIATIVVLGELTPKTYGSLRAEPVALRMARSAQRLTRLLYPITRVLTAISRAFFPPAGGDVEYRGQQMTPEQIRAAAELGLENGQVTAEETEILDSVLQLTRTTAREVMTPRVDIVALSSTAPMDEVVETALSSGYSRIPVYDEDIDHIVGVLYVHDLLATPTEQWHNLSLHDIVREPLLTPESKPVDELLWMMREHSTHLAVLIDEFGSTAGLATIEDILEELVGEIEDEHDLPEQEIELLSPTEAMVDGKARIEDINEVLGTDLPEDKHETAAGLVSGIAGHIPEPGDVVRCGQVRFIIQEGDEQQIQRLRVIALSKGGD